jgi:uncharacterized protein YifE (UPF0438 family)
MFCLVVNLWSQLMHIVFESEEWNDANYEKVWLKQIKCIKKPNIFYYYIEIKNKDKERERFFFPYIFFIF